MRNQDSTLISVPVLISYSQFSRRHSPRLLNLGFFYRYKLGELSLGAGINARLDYVIATSEIRFEVMPVRLGVGYSF